MSIIYTPNLPEIAKNATFVIDACTIIDTTKSEEFSSFLNDIIRKYNISLVSIPAVKLEVLAAADNLQEYTTPNQLIDTLGVIFLSPNIEYKYAQDAVKFSIALRRSKVNKPSLVDRLLLSVPYLFRASVERIFVVTSNHKDVPLEFFDRIAFVAKDNGKEFSEIGVYQFNHKKFQQLTKNI